MAEHVRQAGRGRRREGGREEGGVTPGRDGDRGAGREDAAGGIAGWVAGG